jgi:hypothetical protein
VRPVRSKNGVLQVLRATTPQRATLLRATLPCETALWLFHAVDRRRKLKGWARTWMIQDQDGDQAGRCDGNLPSLVA